ncbi:MAG: lipopolysaccharide assembly protein LapA domain-containing protein [Gammaproteobacteria bacterium]
MRKLILFVILLLIVGLGVVFTVFNYQPARLDLYFVQFSLPLATLLALALLIGALLGMVTAMLLAVRKQREVRNLEKRLKLAEQELNNLRTSPLKDAR